VHALEFAAFDRRRQNHSATGSLDVKFPSVHTSRDVPGLARRAWALDKSAASSARAAPPLRDRTRPLGRCYLEGRAGDAAKRHPLRRRLQLPPYPPVAKGYFVPNSVRDPAPLDQPTSAQSGFLTDDYLFNLNCRQGVVRHELGRASKAIRF
jgi:hypothetical protein